MLLSCCLRSDHESSSDKDQDQGHSYSSGGLQPQVTHFVPPLKPVELPQVHPDHNFPEYGWTIVAPHAELLRSYQTLLEASKEFFDLPEAAKEAYRTPQGSGEGWYFVEGEKEFITLRSLATTPKQMRDAAAKFWDEAGSLLTRILGRIAESLGLPGNSLTIYSNPCVKLAREPTQSMLRLFRYNVGGQRSKIVAEAHRDLGLLSLVMSDTPGLEVCDLHGQRWLPLERTYRSPVLLVGRQLEWLSNSRYRSGGHRVRSYPVRPDEAGKRDTPQRPYRYSIVFVLRAHSPILINTDELTTPITGNFSRPLKGITAGELFRNVQGAHFNINTGVQERDEQKRKLAGKKIPQLEPCSNGKQATGISGR